MQSAIQLQELLRSINRKSYPAYKSLKGVYQFQKYILAIDHVQGDPFASPSHVSVKISHKAAGFPAAYYKDHLTRITLARISSYPKTKRLRYTFPTTWACSGLSPARARPWRANKTTGNPADCLSSKITHIKF